jgi:hypothetical protein
MVMIRTKEQQQLLFIFTLKKFVKHVPKIFLPQAADWFTHAVMLALTNNI